MTTTREAALEAALQEIMSSDSYESRETFDGSNKHVVITKFGEFGQIAHDAISTPTTEPQGYAEGPQFRALKTCKGCAHFKSEYWREPSGDGETYDSGTSADCLKDGRSISTYHGSEPAPPDWCPIAARPAPQPAADMRVVVKPLVWKPEDAPCTRFKAEALGGHMMIVELDPETHPGTYSVGIDLGGLCFKFILAEYDDFLPKYTAPAKFEGIEAAKAAAQADYETRILSAIIGTATPSPSDKIAEAAIDRCMQEIEDIICEADVSYPAGRDAGTSIDFDRDAVLAALRALAGKGE